MFCQVFVRLRCFSQPPHYEEFAFFSDLFSWPVAWSRALNSVTATHILSIQLPFSLWFYSTISTKKKKNRRRRRRREEKKKLIKQNVNLRSKRIRFRGIEALTAYATSKMWSIFHWRLNQDEYCFYVKWTKLMSNFRKSFTKAHLLLFSSRHTLD